MRNFQNRSGAHRTGEVEGRCAVAGRGPRWSASARFPDTQLLLSSTLKGAIHE